MARGEFAQSRYTLFEIVSRSYTSVHHRCRHTSTRKIFNAKRWTSENALHEQLRQYEFSLLSELNIDGVAKPLEFWESAGVRYLIFQEIQGIPLAQHLANYCPHISEILAIAIKTARIVDKLHRRLIAHNDLNPSHIVWNPDNGKLTLVDFENAVSLNPITGRFIVNDTDQKHIDYVYMSPERFGQTRLAPDYRSDLYSIGITLYTMLTGSPPFEKLSERALIHAHMTTPPVPPITCNPSIPQFLSDIVLKLLEKRPGDRYQSAYGALQDLVACQNMLNRGDHQSDPTVAARDYSSFIDFDNTQTIVRPTENELLLNRYRMRGDGALHTVFIMGDPGIGKTATVDSFVRRIAADQPSLLRGKIDQHGIDQPYAIFVDAINNFVHLIFAQGEESRKKWARLLAEKLGNQLSIITDLAPRLKHITGVAAPTYALAPTEAKQRFFSSLVQFFHCVSTHLPNTVLILDNLHLADSDSNELVCHLLSATPTLSMFIVVTARPQEINSEHLAALTDKNKVAMGMLDTITLKPFTKNEISEYLSHLLSMPADYIDNLSNAVLQKTAGNPFFINQFVFELARNGLLYFQHKTRRWRWKTNAIKSIEATDNVVDMLTERLATLTPYELEILSMCACIGQSFSDTYLPKIVLSQSRKLKQTLANLQNMQLIRKIEESDDPQADILAKEPANDNPHDSELINNLEISSVRYEFEHHRIWQAAYDAVSITERQRWHKLIGQSILTTNLSDSPSFNALYHFNRCDPDRMPRGLRLQVCQLNLDGARDACKNSAFALAKSRFHHGLQALPVNSWDNYYDISRDLHLEYAELCSSTADHLGADQTLHRVRNKLNCAADRGRATYLTVVRLTLDEHYGDAIYVGKMGLQELGVYVPTNDLENEIERIVKELKSYDFSQLLNDKHAPRLSADTELAVIMAILMQLLPSTEIHDSQLNDWIAVKMAQLSLTRGLTPESAKGLANFGTALTLRGDYATGYKFGQLALSLIRQPAFAALSPRVLFNFLTYVNHWRDDFDSSRALSVEAMDSCLAYGDVQYRGYIHALHDCMNEIFVRGNAPDQVCRYSGYLTLAKESGNGIASEILTSALIWLNNLQGETANSETFELDGLAGSDHV